MPRSDVGIHAIIPVCSESPKTEHYFRIWAHLHHGPIHVSIEKELNKAGFSIRVGRLRCNFVPARRQTLEPEDSWNAVDLNRSPSCLRRNRNVCSGSGTRRGAGYPSLY